MASEPRQRSEPGLRILIVGTGGQGVLTAARLLCDYLVEDGHSVVSGQLHGMAQRGGSVQSSVIVDGGISPVIPSGRASFVLGFEPVETARALPFMSARTTVYMNTTPVIPYILGQRFVLKQGEASYPDVRRLSECIHAATPHVFPFDATQLAIEAGSDKTLNMVMLGCLFGSGALPGTNDGFQRSVLGKMPARLRKGNVRAFSSGVEEGKRFALAEGKS